MTSLPHAGVDQWISPARASRYLRVSRRTLQRWEERGLLRTARTPSGHRRYLLAELSRLLQGKRGHGH